MNFKLLFKIIASVTLVCLGFAAPGFGEKIEAGNAMTSWMGKGEITSLKDGRVFFHGTVSGVMFTRHYEGSLRGPIHATKMYCPAFMSIDPATKERTSFGLCTFIAHEGQDVAYGRYNCSGTSEDCKGEFTFVGGSGGFKGISGTTPFESRIDLGPDKDGYIHGYMVWPNLTYELP